MLEISGGEGGERMWIDKKIFFIAVIFLIAFLFSVEARAEKRIGVLLFSDEVRYKEATREDQKGRCFFQF